MRILEVASCSCAAKTVRYSVVVESTENDLECYGILVEADGEQVMLPALTVSWKSVTELLEQMARNTVTPITARDVAEDWIER